MSTEQSVNPQAVQQAQQEIRALAIEIAQLAKQDLDQEEFYGAFLGRVVAAMAAVGGAVWVRGDRGSLQMACQINFAQTRLTENQHELARHGKLIQRVFTQGEGQLVDPQSGSGQPGEAANSTPFLLVLSPIAVDSETQGVVEIFQRSGAPLQTQRGYLRFAEEMCELAGGYFKGRQLRHLNRRQTMWNQLESFTRAVHASLDSRQTAYTIANEGCRLIGCDRVSVCLRAGRRCRIEAISGQDTFDRRSNTVVLLGKLASAVTAMGEAVWYRGDTTNFPPEVEETLQDYLDESHSKLVAILPLARPGSGDAGEQPGEVIAALIVEQIEDVAPAEGLVERTDVVCRHASLALANATEHESLFLLPLWRALGKARWVVQARTLPKTIAILATLLLLVLGLVVVPYDFAVEGRGTLEPVLQRDVFAALDGTVEQVHVTTGALVEQGALLVQLRNTDLEVALTDVIGQQTATEEQLLSVERAIFNEGKNLSLDEQNRLAGQRSELKQRLKSLERQLQLYRRKQGQLEVRSPITGQVATWNIDELLKNRPVRQGQVLMEVVDPAGEWELEVRMPEDRMDYVVRAQRQMKEDLDVTFLLLTEPGNEYHGTIKEVHLIAEVQGDEGNTVLLKVKIDPEQRQKLKEYLRPGADAKAKVHCGRRSLGYVLFHDVIAFVQSRILFRL